MRCSLFSVLLVVALIKWDRGSRCVCVCGGGGAGGVEGLAAVREDANETALFL